MAVVSSRFDKSASAVWRADDPGRQTVLRRVAVHGVGFRYHVDRAPGPPLVLGAQESPVKLVAACPQAVAFRRDILFRDLESRIAIALDVRGSRPIAQGGRTLSLGLLSQLQIHEGRFPASLGVP